MVVVDDFTRECLALEIAFSCGRRDVIRTLEGIGLERALAPAMRFDRGSEFTSRAMLQWSAEQSIALQFSDPGKPTQDANVESLNERILDGRFGVIYRSSIASQQVGLRARVNHCRIDQEGERNAAGPSLRTRLSSTPTSVQSFLTRSIPCDFGTVR